MAPWTSKEALCSEEKEGGKKSRSQLGQTRVSEGEREQERIDDVGPEGME